jgi:DNA repair protein RadA/Sms
LVEVQGLVTDSHLAAPRRTVTGVNANRVSLILAVLEKRAGVHFSDKDVFVNVAGGIRLDEPAVDLPVAVALVSSLLEQPVSPHLVLFGEVGLAGEVRAVDLARQRVAEASKFGFTRCILPASCAEEAQDSSATLLPVSGIKQAVELALEH